MFAITLVTTSLTNTGWKRYNWVLRDATHLKVIEEVIELGSFRTQNQSLRFCQDFGCNIETTDSLEFLDGSGSSLILLTYLVETVIVFQQQVSKFLRSLIQTTTR